MTEVAYLVRHGTYDFWNDSERLTQAGREQSLQARDELVARKLGGRAYLLSSDAPRAIQTSEIIAKGLRTDVIPSARLRKASGEWATVDVLGDFLVDTLKIDSHIDADPDFSFVVVAHAPLIATFTGLGDPREVQHGQVHSVPMDKRDPDYDQNFADYILNEKL